MKSEISQRIIDKVNKERREDKILFLKVVLPYLIIVLSAVHFTDRNPIVFAVLLLSMIFVIPVLMTMLRGFK